MRDGDGDAPMRDGDGDAPRGRARLRTGVAGLDDILYGGLPRDRLFLVEGSPGTGKTTLALQFLLEGKRVGESTLYVTLSESSAELHDVADSHGWSLEGIELLELEATESRLDPEHSYTVFHPDEIELGETVKQLRDVVDRIKPARVVLDSMSEMRLLARDPLRFRRQILMLKQYFAGCECTVLLIDDVLEKQSDLHLQSIAHGVVELDRLGQEYGAFRRRLSVTKLRGSRFRDGYHDYTIATGGLRIFPRLVAAEHRQEQLRRQISAGIPELDAILGGGLRTGTSAVVIGTAGSGKSTLAASYLVAASRRNEHSVAYVFEETRQTFIERLEGVSLNIRPALESGLVRLRQLDPAECSPGELSHQIRDDVETRGARVVVLDSLNGYVNSMPNERFVLVQLHELLSYLAEMGVLTILVLAQHGMIGDYKSPVDVSYLADSVILLRYFEHEGAMRKAISVVKHRIGPHEESIRELQISPDGLMIGPILRQFRGVLTGLPEYTGSPAELLGSQQ
jgi:circadian clock protein KaiC